VQLCARFVHGDGKFLAALRAFRGGKEDDASGVVVRGLLLAVWAGKQMSIITEIDEVDV